MMVRSVLRKPLKRERSAVLPVDTSQVRYGKNRTTED
ncbi:MAG: hypothetical protein ACI9AQ_001580 [Dinoroseobacter sp.]